MANTLVREILSSVKHARHYSIMADESRDIANKEQMTFVIGWVSDDLQLNQDFIGMYHLQKTDAETITKGIKDILLRCNLLLSNCRWQGYDGAAAMSSDINGVVGKIIAENLAAIYLHCANHCLDLALKDSVKENTTLRNALDFVQDLSVFIKGSPKRMEEYKIIAGEYAESESLHLLCPTRWTIRTRSITATIKSYSPIYKTLALIASESVKREIKDKANGLRKKMESFDCFFSLFVAKKHI